jgi:hypothetical protein
MEVTKGSRDSSVSTVTTPRAAHLRFDSWQAQEKVYLFRSVKTGSGAHPGPYSAGKVTGG